MGFGRFLELQIKRFLTELSYALLKSYNPMNGMLPLKDGLMVDIIEDDVAAVLSFTWGIIEIKRKKKKKGGRIEARYVPTTADSAPTTGNVQGPSPVYPEVQPQRQAFPQVEPNCLASPKVQTTPVDQFCWLKRCLVLGPPLSQEEHEPMSSQDSFGKRRDAELATATCEQQADVEVPFPVQVSTEQVPQQQAAVTIVQVSSGAEPTIAIGDE
nr:uncharacterized protein LOC109167340 [Ipomoea trifida]